MYLIEPLPLPIFYNLQDRIIKMDTKKLLCFLQNDFTSVCLSIRSVFLETGCSINKLSIVY